MYFFPNLESVYCSMSICSCCFLTWFLRRQIRWSFIPFSLIIFQFVVSYRVKGFGIIDKAEVDVFLEFPSFFYDPVGVGSLIYGSSALAKSSLYIWKFNSCNVEAWLVEFLVLLASMWQECNCVVVWTFFGIDLLWDWNEHWTFPVLWPLLSFPNLLAYWVQHFHSIIF